MRQAPRIIRPPPKEGPPLHFTKDLAYLLRAGRWARADEGESVSALDLLIAEGQRESTEKEGGISARRGQNRRGEKSEADEGKGTELFKVKTLQHLFEKCQLNWKGAVFLGFTKPSGNGYGKRALRSSPMPLTP